MNVLDLQRALHAHAYDPGPLDGAYGPRTGEAVNLALTSLDVSPLRHEDFANAAARLRCEPASVQAVAEIESGLGGFDPKTRRPTILFEPHVFSRETLGAFDQSQPFVSYARWGARLYPRKQLERWRQLHLALALKPGAALRSTSWGAFQIMGFNHGTCGYGTPWAFAQGMSKSSAVQLDALVNFLLQRGLDGDLRERRWSAFARSYNGPRFAEHGYDDRLAAAYRKAAGQRGSRAI